MMSIFNFFARLFGFGQESKPEVEQVLPQQAPSPDLLVKNIYKDPNVVKSADSRTTINIYTGNPFRADSQTPGNSVPPEPVTPSQTTGS